MATPTKKAATKRRKLPIKSKASKHVQPQIDEIGDDQPIGSVGIKSTAITVEAKQVTIPVPPVELRRTLNQRMWDYSVAWVETLSDKHAYETAGYTKSDKPDWHRSPLNTLGVRTAIDWILAEIVKATTISKDWVQARLVRAYDMAMEPEPILSRSGKVVGHRRDLGAALRAIELAGKSIGMFTAQVQHTHGGEIKHLLIAVGSRGKPSLEDRRAEKLVIDSELHVEPKSKPVAQTPKPRTSHE